MRTRTLTLLAALVGTTAAGTAGVVLTGALAAAPAGSGARLPQPAVAPAPVVTPSPVEVSAGARVSARTVQPRRAAPTPVALTVRRPAPAPVPAPVLARAETPAERGARILAALGVDARPLGYRIEFLPGRDGLLGLTVPAQRLVQVYVKDGESDLVLAHSVAHELGHVVDAVRGTAQTRAAFLVLRGLPAGTPWYGCAGCSDYATPAGDWAEVYARWLAGPGDFRSQLAPEPTLAQLSAFAALVS